MAGKIDPLVVLDDGDVDSIPDPFSFFIVASCFLLREKYI
jgi:hypothetical protein